MLRILGKASSINVRKVLWTCEEITIAYTHRDDGPELAKNPNGLVPVIVDDDFVLWESNSIIRYLANKWVAHALLPSNPRARAEVDRWIDWQATEFNNAWRYAFSAVVRQDPAFDDPAQDRGLQETVDEDGRHPRQPACRHRRLRRRNSFTLADIPIGLSVNRWFLTPIDRPRFANVEAYYERVSGNARPSRGSAAMRSRRISVVSHRSAQLY